jgi:starch phosphorylase
MPTTTSNLPAGIDLRDLTAAAADLRARLPEALHPLADVAYNLRWSWHPDGAATFAALGADEWAASRTDPVRFLSRLAPSVLATAAQDEAYVARARALATAISDDLARPFHPDFDPAHPVAFLCAEFGIHPSLPQYSGGLGVLAGDIVKESSDLALPMVAVGLFYKLGYFQQRLNRSGWQIESWDSQDQSRLPIAPALDADGAQLRLTVPVRGREIDAVVWRQQVGRVPMFLLDTDLPSNSPDDRWTTARLYDADPDIRLAQYATLGIGAVRVLDLLGVAPATFHMNEGHAALASLELAAQEVAGGTSFWDAAAVVRERCVFTTHTPVAAGNETYPAGTLLRALPGFAARLGLSDEHLLDVGRVHPDPHAPAGMTPIAMRLSRSTNAVAERHGEVARGMWNELFPGPVDEVPISHVTNGVHLPTWMGAPMHELLDRHLPTDWWRRADDPAVWAPVHDIPAAELWAARTASRTALVQWAGEKSAFDRLRRGEALDRAQAADRVLDPEVLTLGFARRVAGYKRLGLLFRDADRMIRLLGGDRPVQLLIAGKAHPKDDGAKSMVRDLFSHRGNPDVASRVIFLEDYDMEIGRLLTTGADVWLNVPRPPLEASGTSGMKVVLNGGLNLSVLDGWWAEGFGTDAHGVANGWGIDGTIEHDHGHQDHVHAQALLDALEHEVVPTFHDRGDDGLPHGWIAMMRSSLTTLGPRFAATRMMRDYLTRIYPTR